MLIGFMLIKKKKTCIVFLLMTAKNVAKNIKFLLKFFYFNPKDHVQSKHPNEILY